MATSATRVLFVCHANMVRSPLAEGVFRHMVTTRGLVDRFEIASAGVSAFEWARDKDTTYPDASFNLAKQTANAGEVPETVAHLKEVHKRGGKTLLKQVGYDPTFEIVKDDPEISKIVK